MVHVNEASSLNTEYRELVFLAGEMKHVCRLAINYSDKRIS